MPALAVNGQTVYVAYGSGPVNHEPLHRARRAFSGRMRTVTSGQGANLRQWRITTARMLLVEIDELQYNLTQPGDLSVTGDLVKDAPATCSARNVVRRVSPEGTKAILTFELVEKSA